MRRLALAPAAASGMLAAAIVLASCASGGGGPAAAPTASPVKERIAFDRMHGAANYEGSYLGAIIANADGTGQQPLHIPKAWSGPVSPVWSPDGRWIIFSLALPQSAGVSHVYRAWPDGTHLAKVTSTPNSDYLVSWGRPPGR